MQIPKEQSMLLFTPQYCKNQMVKIKSPFSSLTQKKEHSMEIAFSFSHLPAASLYARQMPSSPRHI